MRGRRCLLWYTPSLLRTLVGDAALDTVLPKEFSSRSAGCSICLSSLIIALECAACLAKVHPSPPCLAECETCAMLLCLRCRPADRQPCATGEDGESSGDAIFPDDSEHEKSVSEVDGDTAAVAVAAAAGAEGKLPPIPENGVLQHVRGTVHKAKA